MMVYSLAATSPAANEPMNIQVFRPIVTLGRFELSTHMRMATRGEDPSAPPFRIGSQNRL